VGQGLQAEAPVLEKCPAGQDVQLAAPGPLNVPAGHCWQDPLAFPLNCPAGHLVHPPAPGLEYWPAGQLVQLLAPALLYVLAGQVEQTRREDLYLPAVQGPSWSMQGLKADVHHAQWFLIALWCPFFMWHFPRRDPQWNHTTARHLLSDLHLALQFSKVPDMKA